jgi:hypothetical protein
MLSDGVSSGGGNNVDQKSLLENFYSNITELGNEIYSTLKNICLYNFQNEKVCSNFFDLFLKHLHLDIGAA